jgi:segregation and condensation protein B
MSHAPDPPFENNAQGISLKELAEAYAQAMGAAIVPAAEPPASGDSAPTGAENQRQTGVEERALAAPETDPLADADPETAADDDRCPIGPRTILEAMLFVGKRDGQPLSAASAAELMRGVGSGDIPDLVDQINGRYDENGCPYRVVSETGGYRMVLRDSFQKLRNQFYHKVRETRLSRAAIDVLAIVAYRQPLGSEQVSKLRGKASGQVLAQLVHRGLLSVRRAEPRQAASYCTTERFLSLFGLKSLADLPRSEDLE